MTEIMPFPENKILFYWAAPHRGVLFYWKMHRRGDSTSVTEDICNLNAGALIAYPFSSCVLCRRGCNHLTTLPPSWLRHATSLSEGSKDAVVTICSQHSLGIRSLRRFSSVVRTKKLGTSRIATYRAKPGKPAKNPPQVFPKQCCKSRS